jgi:hypothetical protein
MATSREHGSLLQPVLHARAWSIPETRPALWGPHTHCRNAIVARARKCRRTLYDGLK